MIDEDLYQQATDELNADKRRPHIWARACALASDDHDEARYLYTNLRVEELIAEREREDSGSPPDEQSAHASEEQEDASLALEPLDHDEEIPESVSAPSGVDQNSARDEILTLNSEMEKNNEIIDSIERKSFEDEFDSSEKELDNIDEQDENGYSDEYLDQTINLTSELDGTAVFELDKSDATEFDSKNFDEELVENESGTVPDNEEDDELDALLGGIHLGSPPPPPTDPLADDDTGASMTLDFSDVTGSHGELSPEEDYRELQQFSPEIPTNKSPDETGRLAQELDQDLVHELERQADQLPGQHSDIVAVNNGIDEIGQDDSLVSDEHGIVSGESFEEEAELGIAESWQRNGDSKTPATLGQAASHASERDVREFPIDLSEQQSGRRYDVFRRGHQVQAVKTGASWSALFLTLPFLVYRHLFGTALVYGAMWLIVLAGLLVSGLAWLDAGTAANPILKISTAGFALLAVIGLLYLPFRYCNKWREDKLEQRGFELVARVRASSPGKAISAARRASALD